MTKNVESPAAKSRQTKLSKKSAEELIQIILRKDKTEKSLSAQIINLKNEVNNLTSRIKGYDLDSIGDSKTIEALKAKCIVYSKNVAELTDKNTVLNEQIANLQVLVKDTKDNYNAASYKAATMYNKVKSLRNICLTLIFGWLITIVAIAIF